MEPSYVVGSYLGQATGLVTQCSHDLSVCLNSIGQGKNFSLHIVTADPCQPGRESTDLVYMAVQGCGRSKIVQVREDESATSLGSLVTLFFRLSGHLVFRWQHTQDVCGLGISVVQKLCTRRRPHLVCEELDCAMDTVQQGPQGRASKKHDWDNLGKWFHLLGHCPVCIAALLNGMDWVKSGLLMRRGQKWSARSGRSETAQPRHAVHHHGLLEILQEAYLAKVKCTAVPFLAC